MGKRFKVLGLRNKKQEARNKTSQILASCFLFLLSLVSQNSKAQCAMCRAALQSSENATQAEAINNGIVYLMVIPYILVGIVAFVLYRMFRKKV
jgi:heme/copper-type cytochrome/quinol oxidase subunit 2